MNKPGSRSVQYRVVVTKSEEIIEGPDGADLVVTVPLSVVSGESFDATAEYMRGRLKAAGSTGLLFDILASGVAASELSRLASRP